MNAQEAIGQVEISEGVVTALHADGTTTTLKIGDLVFQGDVIRTADGANIGVTFVDETTFTLDENGELTLDELVYDPGTDTGSFSSSLTSGVFSFVSGQIAKANPDAMEISTPVATIGIRGTQGLIKQDATGPMRAALMEEVGGFTGELILTNAAGTVILNQPNQFSSISSNTSSPAQPVVISQVQLVGAFGRKSIEVLNNARSNASQRRAEQKQQEAQLNEEAALEAEATAEQAKTDAEAAALAAEEAQVAAAAAEGAEAEALLLEAEALALAAEAAEVAFLQAQAEAEQLFLDAQTASDLAALAAQEAALAAEFDQTFQNQISQIEQELNNMINSGIDPFSGIIGGLDNPFNPGGPDGPGNFGDIGIGPLVEDDGFEDFLQDLLELGEILPETDIAPEDIGVEVGDGLFVPENVIQNPSNKIVKDDARFKNVYDDTSTGQTYQSTDPNGVDFILSDDLHNDSFVGNGPDWIYLDQQTTSDITLNLNGYANGIVNYSNGYHDTYSGIGTIQLGTHNNTVNINDFSALFGFTEVHGHTSATTNTLAVTYTGEVVFDGQPKVHYSKFNKLDLTTTGANVTVSIDAKSIKDLSGDQNLYIDGDGADTVYLNNSFALASSADPNYNEFSMLITGNPPASEIYTHKLFIHKSITINSGEYANGGQNPGPSTSFTDSTADAQTYTSSGTDGEFIATDDLGNVDHFVGNTSADLLSQTLNNSTSLTIDLTSTGAGTLIYGNGAQDTFSGMETIELNATTNTINIHTPSDLSAVVFGTPMQNTTDIVLKNTAPSTFSNQLHANSGIYDIGTIDITGDKANPTDTNTVDNILNFSASFLANNTPDKQFTIIGDSGDKLHLDKTENWAQSGNTWTYTDGNGDSYTLTVDSNITVDPNTYTPV